ncbi:cytochrome d ubiquinol oxidase subunit II [Ereboglobus sp. PH5-10]|uniref:cytochrome d ubiquinol oxidase subunit II n=1 Tax=Ereboglobus sp. PH5-10 TaxID=2940629 RepID=UPI0024066342|nr:cytochrome d ubiquinol oxidase subunit II [Ereboglobus sp. PH5-10]MDF9826655.1 cytochrome d ubiquinol oxidase subunit II [Ereboglobus sp. PH5-10]
MTHILIFFIGASLLLYVLLGGSDYGAGILELLSMRSKKLRREQTRAINHAMGPVWEANHVWLILIVVILFMGFPLAFTTLMTALHAPLLALLVGIVVRGATFSFRHYDPVQDEKTQRVYTILFGGSSLWTAMWLGIIAGTLNRGTIPLARAAGEVGAVDAYILPWLDLYPFCVGLFVTCIFAFLASVYMVGETKEPELRNVFTRRAAISNVCVFVAGGVVFLASLLEAKSLFALFLERPAAISAIVIAVLLFVALWKFIKLRNVVFARVVAAGQVTMILLGWWLLYAPNAIITTEGPVSFYEVAAPRATQLQLMLALLVGSCIIFPSLFFLLRVFKTRSETGAAN